MLTFRSRPWFLGLLLLGGATLLVRELSAEVPTIKGIGKVLAIAQVEKTCAASAVTIIASVPADKVWVITDVVMSNPNASAGTLEILDVNPGVDSVTKLPPIQLAAKANFDHQFATGLQFPAGHEVRVFSTVAGTTDVLVSGYFRKQ